MYAIISYVVIIIIVMLSGGVFYIRQKTFFPNTEFKTNKYIKNMKPIKIWKLNSPIYTEKKNCYNFYNILLCVLIFFGIIGIISFFLFAFLVQQNSNTTSAQSKETSLVLTFLFTSTLAGVSTAYLLMIYSNFSKSLSFYLKSCTGFIKTMMLIITVVIFTILWGVFFAMLFYVSFLDEIDVVLTILRWFKQLFFTLIGLSPLLFVVGTFLSDQYKNFNIIKYDELIIKKIKNTKIKQSHTFEIVSNKDYKKGTKIEYFKIDDKILNSVFDDWFWGGSGAIKRKGFDKPTIMKLRYNDDNGNIKKLHISLELYAKKNGQFVLYDINFTYNLLESIKENNLIIFSTDFKKISKIKFDRDYKYLHYS